jgi:hypothetical protein
MKNRLRVIPTIATTLGLAAAGLVLAAGPASANPQANQEWRAEDGGTYLGYPAGGGSYVGHIKTVQNTDKCMAASSTLNWNTAIVSANWAGNPVMLWDCFYTPDSNWSETSHYDADHWYQQDNGDGSWTYSVHENFGQQGQTESSQPPVLTLNFCLDSLNGHAYNGSPIEIWGCNSQDFQKWTIGPSGQLQSVGAGDLGANLCLDDTNWGVDNGSLMQLWQCAY